MKSNYSICIAIVLLILFSCSGTKERDMGFESNNVTPSTAQFKYQQMEMVGFIHYTINTFTDKEWGYGDESPGLFNPSHQDTEQWAQTAKAAGLKELILTAKHHDGFCLWPSKYTDHSIKNSPYKNGKGDIVKEFIEACRKYQLKAGLYLSPWDRNHKDYGKPEYITYYRNQLKELLTQYGEINEIWFDGANGGDGYYGGANEVRKIDRKTYYDWENTFALVKKLQPGILIFSDAGPDIHWIGNESGFAGETFWSTINKEKLCIGGSKQAYLNSGDPNGNDWIIGQCDVSIRPGWFYHTTEDTKIKSPQQLMDIYYKSVGRNAVLLLNLPPDQRGLIHEKDIEALNAFKEIIDETFNENLSNKALATASSQWKNSNRYAPPNVLDNNIETFWATNDSVLPAELELRFEEEITFDRIMIQEPIHFGQRISKFCIEINENNKWKTIFDGTTVGYKRLVRINPETTTGLKLKILESNNVAAVSTLGLYLSSDKKERKQP